MGEFAELVKNGIRDYLPLDVAENADIRVREVVKSNDRRLTALTIAVPGSQHPPRSTLTSTRLGGKAALTPRTCYLKYRGNGRTFPGTPR